MLDGERERCLAAGCDEFVAKPFRAEQIYACVTGLLDVEFSPRSGHRAPPAALSPPTSRASRCPRDLAARMSSAAERAQRHGARSCLDELEGLGSDGRHLAEHLRGFLASYDMDTIQRIVAQISRGIRSRVAHA